MVIERSIKVDEVREESSCRYFAGKLVKVIVAVLRKVAHASLLFPDLNREDGCRAIADTFICSIEKLADHAASLCRGVCTIVDGAEYDLVTTT